MYLRQSTSVTKRFGPFLDENDGRTAETALTIAQADMQLSKNGAAFAQKNASGNATHDADGWYSTTLDATDTATVGELLLQIDVAGAGPVWVRWQVIEEAVYDALYASGATGFGGLDAAGIRAAIGMASDDLDTQLAALPTAAENADAVWTEAIADHSGTAGSTAEALAAAGGAGDPWITTLPGSYTGSQAGKVLADVLADTNELQTDDIPGAIGALNNFNPATDTVATVTTVGSVSGAVGSVTGAVGSVTGNVGGNVVGSVASVTAPVTAGTVSDKTGYSLSSAGIQAIWDALTSALTTVGSIGKLLVDNINATISSRASQTSVDDVPTVAEFEARTIVSANYGTAANQTTLLNRIGAFTGSGVNTVLGFFQAIMRSDATTPSDAGGTYDDGTDSLQAIRDRGDAAWTGSGSVPTAGEIADAVWTEAIADHSGVAGSTAEALNTAASGGSAPTAAQIRAEIDANSTQLAAIVGDTNELQTDWTNGGRLDLIVDAILVDTGTTLPAQISSLHLGAGSGARTVVITVNDGTSPLQNALVRLTEGANTFSGFTDVDGEVTFNLDDATYDVAITKAGYSFTGTTLVVNGDETATYSMSPITFSAPANPAQTTVAVTVVSGTGAAVAGRVVEFLLQSPPAGLGLVYVDTRVTATVPANGITTAALYKGATYKMMVVGGSPWQDLTIPATAGDSYTDVPPLVV